MIKYLSLLFGTNDFNVLLKRLGKINPEEMILRWVVGPALLTSLGVLFGFYGLHDWIVVTLLYLGLLNIAVLFRVYCIMQILEKLGKI